MRYTGCPAGEPSFGVVTSASVSTSLGEPTVDPGAVPGHIGIVKWSDEGGQADDCANATGIAIDNAAMEKKCNFILHMLFSPD
jgi:hypothetical protein